MRAIHPGQGRQMRRSISKSFRKDESSDTVTTQNQYNTDEKRNESKFERLQKGEDSLSSVCKGDPNNPDNSDNHDNPDNLGEMKNLFESVDDKIPQHEMKSDIIGESALKEESPTMAMKDKRKQILSKDGKRTVRSAFTFVTNAHSPLIVKIS